MSGPFSTILCCYLILDSTKFTIASTHIVMINGHYCTATRKIALKSREYTKLTVGLFTVIIINNSY